VAHKFTGQRLDSSTGLYYYHARYYDPQLGRFTQPDTIVQAPADPQTLNRYSYTRNNPVKFVDPSGHSFWDKFKRVYLALVTFGASEIIPATTKAIVKLSDKAGIDARYPLALYAGITAALSGGIGSGVSMAIYQGSLAYGSSLALASGEGRQITQKVAKEFFMDVVGMSPRSAYAAANFTISTGISFAASGVAYGVRKLFSGGSTSSANAKNAGAYNSDSNIYGYITASAERGGNTTGMGGSGGGWGHGWVSLGERFATPMSHGYWPGIAAGKEAALGRAYPGVVTSNPGMLDVGIGHADAWFTFALDQQAFNGAKNYVATFSVNQSEWSLCLNCTDFVVGALEASGIKVPNLNTGPFADPNRLADWLDSLQGI
jgi:RHS repeat-associated protein